MAEYLTPRTTQVLNALRDLTAEKGFPPSIRELGDAVGLGSNSSVSYQLRILVEKGFIRRDPSIPRGTVILGDVSPGARALSDAANAWTQGAWAEVLNSLDRGLTGQQKIAAGQAFGDWLRKRAEAGEDQ